MQEPVRRSRWRAGGPAEGVAKGVAHNDVADGAADAEKVREVALRVPAASPVLDGWAAPGGEGGEDAPLAEELRPRVRLRSAGAEALSAAELLAVLLSAFPGTTEARALELAGRAISERGGLHGLLRSSAHEIMGTVRLGEAKASALLVAAELGKRMVSEPGPRRPVISGPPDVDALLRGRMAHLDRERFVVVLLNTKNAVIASPTVSIGTLSSSPVHPREVFRPAVHAGAAAIILAHNHPSGHVEPSREDREVTGRLARAGETMGIHLLDHLVIGDAFFSFKEHGLI
jgi:DNA repair protein RadC